MGVPERNERLKSRNFVWRDNRIFLKFSERHQSTNIEFSLVYKSDKVKEIHIKINYNQTVKVLDISSKRRKKMVSHICSKIVRRFLRWNIRTPLITWRLFPPAYKDRINRIFFKNVLLLEKKINGIQRNGKDNLKWPV
jgi:hypothetical protein